MYETIFYAAVLMMDAHEGQYRKDGVTPFSNHPIGVARLVNKYIRDDLKTNDYTTIETVVITAIAHDLVEDVKGFDLNKYLEDVNPTDKKSIYKLVMALTKDTTGNNRLEKCINSYKKIYDAGVEAVLIKLCDRYNNLLDFGVEQVGLSIEYQRMYVQETFLMLGFFSEFKNLKTYQLLFARATELSIILNGDE